jgi:TRAP-type mannitol/chloroaromatic compound transport system permease small subunit
LDRDATRLAAQIDSQLDRIVGVISWIWLGLIALIVLTVILRFVFSAGRIELEELEWHLYAVGFLTGIVACTVRDRHVRVDVFRERMSARTRAWIDFYGTLLLQLPFLALLLWSSWYFVVDSYVLAERSAAAGGLSHRWILKAFLPTSLAMLVIATTAQLLRILDALFGHGAREGRR